MDTLKFYVKIMVLKVRALLFFLAPVRANRNSWDVRVLIINLDLIGDVVMFTAVLKHYRVAMPGKKLYLLLNGSSGVDPELVHEYVDEVWLLNTEAFKSDPCYGYRFVKKLRRVGFGTVIEHNPAAEFVGKVIAVELGAPEVIGYHGFLNDDILPTGTNFTKGLHYFRNVLSKKFTRIIPTVPDRIGTKRAVHMISHYAAIFAGVTGQTIADLTPRLPAELSSDEAVKSLLSRNGITLFSYAFVALGTSTASKEWPVERFAALCRRFVEQGIPIVLAGTKKDVSKSQRFIVALGREGALVVTDFTGRTSLLQVASLVKFSLVAVSNDTSIVHLAIAFKRPSVTVMLLTSAGRTMLYGYADINRWVHKGEDFPCWGENGRCLRGIGPQDPAPCLAAVTVEEAERELAPLLGRILSDRPYPAEPFSLAV